MPRLRDGLQLAVRLARRLDDAASTVAGERRGTHAPGRLQETAAQLLGSSEHQRLVHDINLTGVLAEHKAQPGGASPDLDRLLDGIQEVHDRLPAVLQAQLGRDLTRWEHDVRAEIEGLVRRLGVSTNTDPVRAILPARDGFADEAETVGVGHGPLTPEGVRRAAAHLTENLNRAAEEVLPDVLRTRSLMDAAVGDELGPAAEAMTDSVEFLERHGFTKPGTTYTPPEPVFVPGRRLPVPPPPDPGPPELPAMRPEEVSELPGVALVRDVAQRANDHLQHSIDQEGTLAAWPQIKKEAGDPITALQLSSALQPGAYVGEDLTPPQDAQHTSVYVSPDLSTIVTGNPGTGKTRSVMVPRVHQDLAARRNVVLVTPHPKTVDAAYPLADALTGGTITIIDFGGELVTSPTDGQPASRHFTSWDPTRGCDDPAKAREFGLAFAGPNSPLQKEFGEGKGIGYWAVQAETMFGLAAHLTAHQRLLLERAGTFKHGLLPNGANGMGSVLRYLEPVRSRDENAGIPELPEEHNAMSHRSGDTEGKTPYEKTPVEMAHERAAAYAKRFHPMVRGLAYSTWQLLEAGAPLDDRYVGEALDTLSSTLSEADEGRGGNHLPQMLSFATSKLPAVEVRVASPHPGDREITPEQLVSNDGGLTIIGYSNSTSTGQLPAVLADSVIAAAFKASNDAVIAELMGGPSEPTGLTVVVDEGGATGHLGSVDDVVTDGRQQKIAVMVSDTSEAHMITEIGPERTAKLYASAPVVMMLSPPDALAESISEALGTTEEVIVTGTVQNVDKLGTPTSYSETRSVQETRNVPASAVKNLPLGVMVLATPTGTTLVRVPNPEEPGTPVVDADAHARAVGLPGAPWATMRPDVHERVRSRLDTVEAGTVGLVPAALTPVVGRRLPEPKRIELSRAEPDVADATSPPEDPARVEPGGRPTVPEAPTTEPPGPSRDGIESVGPDGMPSSAAGDVDAPPVPAPPADPGAPTDKPDMPAGPSAPVDHDVPADAPPDPNPPAEPTRGPLDPTARPETTAPPKPQAPPEPPAPPEPQAPPERPTTPEPQAPPERLTTPEPQAPPEPPAPPKPQAPPEPLPTTHPVRVVVDEPQAGLPKPPPEPTGESEQPPGPDGDDWTAYDASRRPAPARPDEMDEPDQPAPPPPPDPSGFGDDF